MKHTTRNANNKNATDNLFSNTSAGANSGNVIDFSSTLEKLRHEVDPEMIRHRGTVARDGNSRQIEYVEWHTVADILDSTSPSWSHSIKDIRPIGEIVTVTVAITIDGVTREGIGTGRATSETGIKKAEHDALKRAAVKFGVARSLYKRENDAAGDPVEENVEANSPDLSTAPMAASIGDMITHRQLNMIRAMARETGVDAGAECSKLFGCQVDELSKHAASRLIDHIKRQVPATAEGLRRAG